MCFILNYLFGASLTFLPILSLGGGNFGGLVRGKSQVFHRLTLTVQGDPTYCDFFRIHRHPVDEWGRYSCCWG